ncbi:MAG: threonine synthase [Xanthomonadales bacterium]|jgi:threonine synthase|nr:threonine synthase [Xanthomonadales bacterium]
MSYATHLECTACGATYPADAVMNLCPVDQRPVQIVLDLERLARDYPGTSWHTPARRNLWRFGPLLALDRDDPADARHIVSLGEGCTPQLDYGDYGPARAARLCLSIKDEGKAHSGFGANPTQSFKDRGMTMTVSMARRLGLERLAIPTQGNAGDSLCAYAEAGGLSAVVAMPDDTPMPILGRVAALAQTTDRFHLELVKGTIREAGELLKERWIPDGWFSVATFQEPGWRIEGKKTLGLELAEPSAPGEPWSLPDVVLYPTGGGTGVLGMWKAWDELEALGVIGSDRPRVICVQFEGTAPLVQALEAGRDDTTPVEAHYTIAYGLNVPGGVGQFKVLDIVRRSGGTAIAVAERDIETTLSSVWRDKGWWISPEGAACLAALPALLDTGQVRPGERVVSFNTGSLEKYLPSLRHLL